MPIPEQLQGRLRLPVVAAPMFLVSGPKLVTAACRAGVLGTFPALNQRTTEGFDGWLGELNDALTDDDAPYGVNLIVHRSNPRVEADLEVCVKRKVPLVITSLGAVSELVATVHSYGGLVFHDVTNIRHAKKAVDAGVDGIIAVAGGAGGHAGTTHPFALVDEIRGIFDGTILLAGCISNGRQVAGAIAAGADLAYMGTRFIATEESRAQAEYKQMLLDAVSGDIVYTPAVSGVPANFIRQSLEANGFDVAKLREPGEVAFGEKLTMGDEAKAWSTIWSAGHGVASIDDVLSTAGLIERLGKEYREAAARLGPA